MSHLVTIAVEKPPYCLALRDLFPYVEPFSVRWGKRPEVLVRILENSRVMARYSVLPLDQLMLPRTFKECNDLFIKWSVDLGKKAILRCLEQARLHPTDIDLLITVSCTGVMIPSMDAFIIDQLGMRRDCKRIPITELGCAAGAVGLARAHDYVKAFPDANVLVLAAEFPTLTFQIDDVDMAHVVSSIIFGDGVACALVSGQKKAQGLELLSTSSYLFPDSSRYMGFDVDSDGFHIVLDKCVPYSIRAVIKELVTSFVHSQQLTLSDLSFYALHPAGKKVLIFMEEELGIAPAMTQSTWNVLRDNGNMSSASILYVLEDLMRHATPRPGQYGALMAFGPGFSAEMVLGRWEA